MVTLINSVYDFNSKQVFPKVGQYLAFYNVSQEARTHFNAILLRNLHKAKAYRTASSLVIRRDITPLLDLPKKLATVLEIVPAEKAEQEFLKTLPQKKEPAYFYTLLDYSLNKTFLSVEDYFTAHYIGAGQEKERDLIISRIETAIEQKNYPEQPVLHIAEDIKYEITRSDITKHETKLYLDQAIKADELKKFERNKDLVLRFYGFKPVNGNPSPEG